jgi:hypothetical protein
MGDRKWTWWIGLWLLMAVVPSSRAQPPRLIQTRWFYSQVELSKDGRIVLFRHSWQGGDVSALLFWQIDPFNAIYYLRADGSLTQNPAEALQYITRLSYDGTIAVGSIGYYEEARAIIWRYGVGVEYLPHPDPNWLWMTGISLSWWDGRVVYGAAAIPSGNTYAYIAWRYENGVVQAFQYYCTGPCSADGSCVLCRGIFISARWCEDVGFYGPGGCCISADGRIVAGGSYRWVEGQGFEWIDPPYYPRYTESAVLTMSSDGRILAGIYFRSQYDDGLAFWWREGLGSEDLTERFRPWLGDGIQLLRVESMSADGRYLLCRGTRYGWGICAILDTGLIGDVDGNGCVDDADLLAVLFAFGQVGSGLPEDVNGNGEVEARDLLEVLFYFGNGCR